MSQHNVQLLITDIGRTNTPVVLYGSQPPPPRCSRFSTNIDLIVVRNAEGAEYNTAKMEQYLVSALGGHAAVVFQHHIRKPVETGFECLT